MAYAILAEQQGPGLRLCGQLTVGLPALELPVDRLMLQIATPREILLYGETGGFVSSQATLTGVLERVLALHELPRPIPEEFPFGCLGIVSYQSRRGSSAPLMHRSRLGRDTVRDESYDQALLSPSPQAMPERKKGVFGLRKAWQAKQKGRMRELGAQSRPVPAQEADLDLLSNDKETLESSLVPTSPGSAESQAGAAAEQQRIADQRQVADFLAVMKKTGASKGALPIDIQLSLENLDPCRQPPWEYVLTLARENELKPLHLSYVSMRWGGAIAGVVFFLLPVALVNLGLARGLRGTTRALALVGLIASGLVAGGLTLWGLPAMKWFLFGIPAGVLAWPALQVNRLLWRARPTRG